MRKRNSCFPAFGLFILGMAKQEKERKREQNWSVEEKDCLRELVSGHRSVIDSKENDSKMIQKKKAAWEAIRCDMLDCGFERDVCKLKQQWDRLKIMARKSTSEMKKPNRATANGCEVHDETDQKIGTMLQIELMEDTIMFNSNTMNENPLSDDSWNAEDDDIPYTTPNSNGSKKPLTRLIRERQTNIGKESAHEIELHLLRVQKLRAEIAQQAEIHELKKKHMIEMHIIRCNTLRRQNRQE